jgi:hypothetical protein
MTTGWLILAPPLTILPPHMGNDNMYTALGTVGRPGKGLSPEADLDKHELSLVLQYQGFYLRLPSEKWGCSGPTWGPAQHHLGTGSS